MKNALKSTGSRFDATRGWRPAWRPASRDRPTRGPRGSRRGTPRATPESRRLPVLAAS